MTVSDSRLNTSRTVRVVLAWILVAWTLVFLVSVPSWDDTGTAGKAAWMIGVALVGVALAFGALTIRGHAEGTSRRKLAEVALVAGALGIAFALVWSIMVPLIALALIILRLVEARIQRSEQPAA